MSKIKHSKPLSILRAHGISVRQIARQVGVQNHTAAKALDPEKATRVVFGNVIKVREEAIKQLRAKGWTGRKTSLFGRDKAA